MPPKKRLPHPADGAMDLLRKYGTRLGVSRPGLEHAEDLARGHTDLIVLLLEPLDVKWLRPIDEAIALSPTLKEVDQLLRFGSRGQRNAINTCILDVRLFRSAPIRDKEAEVERKKKDELSFKVVEAIIKTLKPEVIISCQCATAYANNDMARMLCGSFEPPCKPEWRRVNGQDILVVRAFHPSMYKQEYIREYYKCCQPGKKPERDRTRHCRDLLQLLFTIACHCVLGEHTSKGEKYISSAHFEKEIERYSDALRSCRSGRCTSRDKGLRGQRE